MSGVQVVILCGGKGTRLGDVTQSIPKPLVSILEKPFLEWQIDYAVESGFKDFLLLAGYLGDQIESHFLNYRSSKGVKIRTVIEEKSLGTAGALRFAERFLFENFLLMNGDSMLYSDYRLQIQKHFELKADMTMAAYKSLKSTDLMESNNLEVDGEVVKSYVKRGCCANLTHLDAGVYVASKRILNYVCKKDPEFLSLEKEIMPRIISADKMRAFEVFQKPFDIGTPERLVAFKEFLCKQRDRNDYHENPIKS